MYKTYKIVLLVLLATMVFYQNTLIASQEPHLSFTQVVCGIGMFHSHQGYRVSDGTFIMEAFDYYESDKSVIEDLKKGLGYEFDESITEALKKKLAAATKILNEETSKDPVTLEIKQKFIIEILNENVSEIVLIQVDGKSIHTITGASLRHINEFRKSLTIKGFSPS